MPYVLVILRAGDRTDEAGRLAADHERFIDSLIERNLVLLGGELAPALGGADGAYLLRRAGVEEARAVAAEDPLVAHGVSSPECVEWRLVGINPDAIGPSTVVRPGDV